MDDRLWWLRDHMSPTGRRDVRNDYNRASEELQAAFDTHWEYLRVRPRDQWVRPAAHKLRPENGGYREFFEFRFKSENTQQRPLGYFGQDPKHFTLLIWATEKGSKFVPLDAVKTCETRRNSIVEGKSTCVAWSKDEEEGQEDENDKAGKAETQAIPRRLR
jgi:hypothetical protein